MFSDFVRLFSFQLENQVYRQVQRAMEVIHPVVAACLLLYFLYELVLAIFSGNSAGVLRSFGTNLAVYFLVYYPDSYGLYSELTALPAQLVGADFQTGGNTLDNAYDANMVALADVMRNASVLSISSWVAVILALVNFFLLLLFSLVAVYVLLYADLFQLAAYALFPLGVITWALPLPVNLLPAVQRFGLSCALVPAFAGFLFRALQPILEHAASSMSIAGGIVGSLAIVLMALLLFQVPSLASQVASGAGFSKLGVAEKLNVKRW